MSNKKLSKRINTLLENKSNKFKEKYYLLSYLANTNIASDERLMSEADCYINSLINTNGEKPSINHLQNIIKESIKEKYPNSYNQKTKSISSLCKQINNTKVNPSEVLVLEELNSIQSLQDFKINEKLKESFIQSVMFKKPLLISEAMDIDDKKSTFDADDFLDDPFEPERSSNKKNQKINMDKFSAQDEEFFEDFDDDEAYFVEDFGDYDDEESQFYDDYDENEELYQKELNISKRELNNRQRQLLVRYAWLLKRKNIPFIRKKLGFFVKEKTKQKNKEGKIVEVPVAEDLSKLPMMDKLAIISRYRLIVEQGATNISLRKYFIIQQIFYYLNIQSRFLDAEIIAMADKSLAKDRSRYTGSPSNLSPEQKKRIKDDVNALISKINLDDASSLETDVVYEDELQDLLYDSAGASQREQVKKIIDYLDVMYPIDNTSQNATEKMSDEEYEEYQKQNLEFDERETLEDLEELSDVPLDENGEPLYSDVESAKQVASTYIKDKDRKEVTMHLRDAVNFLKLRSKMLGVIDNIDKVRKKGRGLSDENKRLLSVATERVKAINGLRIKIIPNKKMNAVYEDLLNSAGATGGVNTIDKKTGRITSTSWADFFKDYISYDPEEPVSSADIARLSQKQWTGTAGVRQALTKSWYAARFFASNNDIKAEFYSILGEKYIDTARKLGLFEDDIVDDKGFYSVGEDGQRVKHLSLEKLEDFVANKQYLKDYFEGRILKDEDEDVLDFLVMGMSSFRIFANEILNSFYANRIWNKAEKDLAYAIKEYFAEKYPESKIGYNLKPGDRSSKVRAEYGKDLFDKIIYWTMSRTGILDKGNVLPNPEIELENRKEFFRKGRNDITSIVRNFNSRSQPNKIKDFDIEHLMNDCLNDRSKVSDPFPIIGKIWETSNKISANDRKLFVDFLNSKSEDKFELKLIQSLMEQEYYEKVFNNPQTPLGNPEEIKAIKKGTASTALPDVGKAKSFEGAPYYVNSWQKEIKEKVGDLLEKMKTSAEARAERFEDNKDYIFLDDAALEENDFEIMWKGNVVEAGEVNWEEKTLNIVYDTFNKSGEIIDTIFKTVPFSEVSPITRN